MGSKDEEYPSFADDDFLRNEEFSKFEKELFSEPPELRKPPPADFNDPELMRDPLTGLPMKKPEIDFDTETTDPAEREFVNNCVWQTAIKGGLGATAGGVFGYSFYSSLARRRSMKMNSFFLGLLTVLHGVSAGMFGVQYELRNQIKKLDDLDTNGPIARGWKDYVEHNNPWLSEMQMQKYQDKVTSYAEGGISSDGTPVGGSPYGNQ